MATVNLGYELGHRYAAGPDSLDRFNNLPAVKIIGQAAPGYSSGQAIARVEQIAREVLPSDFTFDWGGTSYQEKRSSGSAGFALGGFCAAREADLVQRLHLAVALQFLLVLRLRQLYHVVHACPLALAT